MIFEIKVLDFPREMCKVDDNTQLIHFNVEVDLYTIHSGPRSQDINFAM